MRAVAWTSLIIGVISCTGGDTQRALSTDVIRRSSEPGRFAGVTSLDDGRVVVGLSGRAPEPGRLALVDAGTGELAPLPLPQRPECRRTDYLRPHRLPDGRLGAVRGCVPIRAGSDQLVAITLDPISVEVLADPGDPVAEYAWTPDAAHAAVESGSDLCAGLATVPAGGTREPMDLTVRGDGEPFEMVDALASAGGGDCESTGWARWPSIDANSALAFFASTRARGVAGMARAESPSGLYVVGADAETAEPLLTNVVEPRSLAWSPDGEWLAFGAVVDDVAGAWLFHEAEHALVRVHDGPVNWLAWKADGDGLLVLVPSDGPDPMLLDLLEVSWSREMLEEAR